VPRRHPPPSQSQSVRLKPADPFDLIRWLARSQSDPRKAIAEFVQNSIDAKARRIRIERRRVRRSPALVVRDDGEGVLPEMAREDALRAIATNIGCSRKRSLTPLERHAQVVAGKYGIGLLGFWSVGGSMDIRSRVGSSEVFVLRLREDEERAEIFRDALAMDEEPTFTEIVIMDVHDSATRVLSPRRLVEYLGAELRGTLLASAVEVTLFDGLARGTASRNFSVVPRRYTGEPVNVPSAVSVNGYSAIRVELYFARGAEAPMVELACAGTLVADDLQALAFLGLAEAPWIGRGLSGLIDFPDFSVPPGTRRGVVPDAAAEAFASAMRLLAPAISAELDRMDRERGAAATRQVMTDLRRAFRGLRARLPQYELPPVQSEDGVESDAAGSSGVLPAGQAAGDSETEPETKTEDDDEASANDEPGGGSGEPDSLDLFPPGPLATVTIKPPELRIQAGRERRVNAVATDADGRKLSVRIGDGAEDDATKAGLSADGRRVEGVTFSWSTDSPALSILGSGKRPAVLASTSARPGAREIIRVTARQGSVTAIATATAIITDTDELELGARLGIPEPELVDDPGTAWRSRFFGQRWQVNAGHEDFSALAGEPRGRVRYLLTLLAKEIVQRTHGGPGADAALEGLVEILAHAERNLRGE
jgi:Histidine kinase-, DNA gyrase B-, and HSP90-like ATPase